MRPLIALLLLTATLVPVHAALLGRDLNASPGSFEAYYDTTLNITWLADANLAASNTFGVGGIAPAGDMDWYTAQAWVAAMNGASYLGITSWRLPHMIDIDADGCPNKLSYNGPDCGYNVVSTGPNAAEMASLFYDTLGNLAYFNSSGVPQLPNIGIQYTGPFSNLGNKLYWYDLDTDTNGDGTTLPNPDNGWYFGMPSGAQRPTGKSVNSPTAAWAVFDGDIAAVPVPGAVWLLGSAIALVGWLRRRIVS